jgi:hypothetical protein
MSRIEATPNTDCPFRAEQKPLAANQHAYVSHGPYADWPRHVLVLAARHMQSFFASCIVCAMNMRDAGRGVGSVSLTEQGQ